MPEPQNPTAIAESTLRTALEIVSGERQREYGDPRTNLTRIADLWSIVLGTPVNPADVALCLAQLKVARLLKTPHHHDSWVDLAGYAALGSQVAREALHTFDDKD